MNVINISHVIKANSTLNAMWYGMLHGLPFWMLHSGFEVSLVLLNGIEAAMLLTLRIL